MMPMTVVVFHKIGISRKHPMCSCCVVSYPDPNFRSCGWITSLLSSDENVVLRVPDFRLSITMQSTCNKLICELVLALLKIRGIYPKENDARIKLHIVYGYERLGAKDAVRFRPIQPLYYIYLLGGWGGGGGGGGGGVPLDGVG